MNDKNNEHVVRAIWLKYVVRMCVDSKTLVLIYFSLWEILFLPTGDAV